MSNIYNNTLSLLEEMGLRKNFYLDNHPHRYKRTLEHLDYLVKNRIDKSIQPRALEIGSSWVLNLALKILMNFERVDITTFSEGVSTDSIVRKSYNSLDVEFGNISVDLEFDKIPRQDSYYDLVVMCEVIEHFDRDPMFVMSEINRITKLDGLLFLTTPNSTSSKAVERILKGYSPGFFMKYERNSSPYKHNFEYSVYELVDLVTSSGYEILSCTTEDLFSQSSKYALDLLAKNNLPLSNRGDDIVLIAKKSSGVVNRYPNSVYI